MRGALLAVAAAALAIGCQRKSEPGGDAPKSKDTSESFPAATTKLRVAPYELRQHYAKEDAGRHPHEGKRIITRLDGLDGSLARAGGKSVFLESDEKGLRRPAAVYIFRDTRDALPEESIYVEGTLRGAVGFATQPWAKEWLNRSPGGLKDRFVLVEDVTRVAAP